MIKAIKKWFYLSQIESLEWRVYLMDMTGKQAIEENSYWHEKLRQLQNEK